MHNRKMMRQISGSAYCVTRLSKWTKGDKTLSVGDLQKFHLILHSDGR